MGRKKDSSQKGWVIVQPKPSAYRGFFGVGGIFEPLAACYIAAALEQNGYAARVIHQINESNEEIVDSIRDIKPAAIGFSTYTDNFLAGIVLADKVKELHDIPVIFGGWFASFMPEYCLTKFPSIDFVVIGEGERTIQELAEALENNGDFSKISGLAYRQNGSIVINPSRPRIKDLNELPLPKRQVLATNNYKILTLAALPFSERRVGSLHTARGCRFDCDFCCTPAMYPKQWRGRTAHNMGDEVGLLIAEGANYIIVRDEDSFADKKRILEFCKEIEKRNLNFYWRSFVNPKDIQTKRDKELLQRMKNAGYTSCLIGIESMNEALLHSVNKKLRIEQTRIALEILDEAGIFSDGTYMIGYPDETEEMLQESLEQLLQLPVDELYVAFITPFPGTLLYHNCLKNDLFLPGMREAWNYYNAGRPIIKSPIPPERLIEIKDDFIKRFKTEHFPERMRYRLEQEPAETKPQLIKMYREYTDLFFNTQEKTQLDNILQVHTLK